MLPEVTAAYRVAVIGAGVAGSVCATRLAQLPYVATTVYDMGSRGPGGRACSRPVDGIGGGIDIGLFRQVQPHADAVPIHFGKL